MIKRPQYIIDQRFVLRSEIRIQDKTCPGHPGWPDIIAKVNNKGRIFGASTTTLKGGEPYYLYFLEFDKFPNHYGLIAEDNISRYCSFITESSHLSEVLDKYTNTNSYLDIIE